MAWTNITNGTLPDADEVMGNFNLLSDRLVKATLTSATEESHTGDSNYTTIKTGTI